MSPSSPPTANATMIVNDEGSMFGGHSARRKFGGPDMYAVARRALIAGDAEGKRTAKILVMREGVDADSSALTRLRVLTK